MSPLSPQRGGAQSGAVRHTRSITSFNYTLASATYPSGYNPTCGSSLNAYWVADDGIGVSSNFSWGGGQVKTIYVGPCHAAAGDSMSVTLTDVYGGLGSPSHPSPGNFTLQDTGNDTHATMVITDNTTGHSLSTDVWISY